MIKNLFLSVGAMKAGTTWVYDKLQHNPNIHFSNEKEIYYFSHIDGVANSLSSEKRIRRAKRAIKKSSIDFKNKDINIHEHMETLDWYLNYSSYETNDKWYESLFLDDKRNSNDVFCSDFSNLNCFLSDEGWKHVRSTCENLKVIYILRNPIERFWSHYKFHLQFINHSEMNTPEGNIKLFNRITSKPWFIRNSMYSDNIDNMKRNLLSNEFKIYYLDDIANDPERSLKDIEDFIGVKNHDYSHLKLDSKKNSSINKKIPLEWESEIKKILDIEIKKLKKGGYFHNDWL